MKPKNKTSLLDIFIAIIYLLTIIQFFVGFIYDNYIFLCITQIIMTAFSFKRGTIKTKEIAFMLIISLATLGVTIINGGGIGSIIIYIALFINIWWVKTISFTEKTTEIIKKIFQISCVLLSLYSPVVTISFMESYTGLNPNLYAQILLYSLIIFCIFDSNNRKKCVITTIIVDIAIIITGSRIATISALLFSLFILIKRQLSFKIFIVLLSVIVIAGIITPIIYTSLFDINSQDISLGSKKLFSGREVIWSNIYKMMNDPKNIMVGVGSKTYFAERYIDTIDAHNIYLSPLCNYGILLTIVIYMYMFRGLNRKSYNISYYAYIGLLAILLCGTFENPIFWEKSILLFSTIIGTCHNNKTTQPLDTTTAKNKNSARVLKI